MANLIVYLLAVGLTCYLNIMYPIPYGPALIGCELGLLILCLLQAWRFRDKISLELFLASPVVRAGETVRVSLRVKNTSRLPIPFIHIWVDKREDERAVRKCPAMSLSLTGGQEDTAELQIESRLCGRMHIAVRKTKIFDYLHLFSFSKARTCETQVHVLPRIYHISVTVSDVARMFPADSGEYSKEKSGDDSSEVFDVRQYRQGDRPQQVHWKLSARKEELYVKEYSLETGASIIILIESAKGGSEPEKTAACIDAAASVSNALLEEQCPHYVAWQNQMGEVIRAYVDDEDSFHDMETGILELMSYTAAVDTHMEEVYMDEFKGERYHTMLCFTSDGQVRQNGTAILKPGQDLISQPLEEQILHI